MMKREVKKILNWIDKLFSQSSPTSRTVKVPQNGQIEININQPRSQVPPVIPSGAALGIGAALSEMAHDQAASAMAKESYSILQVVYLAAWKIEDPVKRQHFCRVLLNFHNFVKDCENKRSRENNHHGLIQATARLLGFREDKEYKMLHLSAEELGRLKSSIELAGDDTKAILDAFTIFFQDDLFPISCWIHFFSVESQRIKMIEVYAMAARKARSTDLEEYSFLDKSRSSSKSLGTSRQTRRLGVSNLDSSQRDQQVLQNDEMVSGFNCLGRFRSSTVPESHFNPFS